MAMQCAENFMTSTIAAENIKTGENRNCFVAPEKSLCCEHGKGTQCGCGGDSGMAADKRGFVAPSSAMKADTLPVSLSDRLTPLLISAGLVCGIIPLCMRDASGQQTLDAVLRRRDGKSVAEPKAVF
jgi:hypothetical protein